MNNDQPITKDYFIKRLTDLCLKSGLAGFPKNRIDEQILLKSAIVMIGPSGNLTEQAINERLDAWVHQVSQNKGIDRVSLRRRLVDTGYLMRSKDGANYQVASQGTLPQSFEAEIDGLNIPQVIETARDEITRRKMEYMAKAKGR